MSPLPEFKGWRQMSLDESVKAGDVYIYNIEYVKQYNTPERGHSVGKNEIGRSAALFTDRPYYCLYRRTGPVKLPSNPIFSRPLPLP